MSNYFGEPYEFEEIGSIQIKSYAVLKFKIATKPSTGEQFFQMNEESISSAVRGFRKSGPTITLSILPDVIKALLAAASPFTSGSSSVYKSTEELRWLAE